jgi:triosephosphate isomerase
MQIILSAPNFSIFDNDGLDLFARTGSVSIELLHKAGAQGVIFGHSEVGDSPEIINQKLLTLQSRQTVLDADCLRHSTILIGETWEEFYQLPNSKVAENVIKRAEKIFTGVAGDLVQGMFVGYEPKWGTRGSGQAGAEPASVDLVDICNKAIKNYLAEKYGLEVANSIKYIFGGMTTPERAESLIKLDSVDGLILGSATNTVAKFKDIARAMKAGAPDKLKLMHVNMKAFNRTDSDEEFIEAMRSLDNTFQVVVSPPLTDIYKFSTLIKRLF